VWNHRRAILTAVVLASIRSSEATAGMPAVTLGDVKRALVPSSLSLMRLEVISFFALAFLAFAWAIQLLWNSLRKDFVKLPRLSYGKAVGLLLLWGLLFLLVLTMISGARELMTPGAWEKQGATYRLAKDQPSAAEREITERYQAIERLRDLLMRYAQGHDRRFPSPAEADRVIPDGTWRMPGPRGGRYVYLGGVLPDEDYSPVSSILVHEAETVGSDRLVVRTDGTILWLPIAEIERITRGGPS
jgi:hypothetical protein